MKDETKRLVTIKEISKITGWRPKRVTAILKRAGLLTNIGGDGRRARYVTTLARIRSRYPEIAEIL